MNNQGTMTSTYAVPPILDAIQEFKVQSHNDLAEFGGVTGGVVNVVTKSGSNEITVASGNSCATTTWMPATRSSGRGPRWPRTCLAPRGWPDRQEQDILLRRFSGLHQPRTCEPQLSRAHGCEQGWRHQRSARQIYDPYSTRIGPDGTAVRDAFANNMIPPVG